MKKIIAALLAVVMIMTVAFAFASCSSKKYTDKEVTIPVTDENGETVTDEQGKVVTEVSTESGKDGNTSSTVSASKTNASSKASSTKKNGTAKANKEDKTTKKASSTKKAETTKKNEATTDKKETTTKETTTEKPEKREVIVRVQLPNSSDLKQAKLTIKYKTEKDKEYKTLKIDDPNDKKNQLGDLILPIAAIRGEGTSNDYFPPEVPALPAFMLQRAVSSSIRDKGRDYWTGTVYTAVSGNMMMYSKNI
jgi:hypothetical protein